MDDVRRQERAQERKRQGAAEPRGARRERGGNERYRRKREKDQREQVELERTRSERGGESVRNPFGPPDPNSARSTKSRGSSRGGEAQTPKSARYEREERRGRGRGRDRDKDRGRSREGGRSRGRSESPRRRRSLNDAQPPTSPGPEDSPAVRALKRPDATDSGRNAHRKHPQQQPNMRAAAAAGAAGGRGDIGSPLSVGAPPPGRPDTSPMFTNRKKKKGRGGGGGGRGGGEQRQHAPPSRSASERNPFAAEDDADQAYRAARAAKAMSVATTAGSPSPPSSVEREDRRRSAGWHVRGSNQQRRHHTRQASPDIELQTTAVRTGPPPGQRVVYKTGAIVEAVEVRTIPLLHMDKPDPATKGKRGRGGRSGRSSRKRDDDDEDDEDSEVNHLRRQETHRRLEKLEEMRRERQEVAKKHRRRMRKVRKAVPETEERMVKRHLASGLLYGAPGTDGSAFSNYLFYVRNNHPFFSIFLCHQKHPLQKHARIVIFVAAAAFAFFITVFIAGSNSTKIRVCDRGCGDHVVDLNSEVRCYGTANEGKTKDEYDHSCNYTNPYILATICALLTVPFGFLMKFVAKCGCVQGRFCNIVTETFQMLGWVAIIFMAVLAFALMVVAWTIITDKHYDGAEVTATFIVSKIYAQGFWFIITAPLFSYKYPKDRQSFIESELDRLARLEQDPDYKKGLFRRRNKVKKPHGGYLV